MFFLYIVKSLHFMFFVLSTVKWLLFMTGRCIMITNSGPSWNVRVFKYFHSHQTRRLLFPLQLGNSHTSQNGMSSSLELCRYQQRQIEWMNSKLSLSCMMNFVVIRGCPGQCSPVRVSVRYPCPDRSGYTSDTRIVGGPLPPESRYGSGRIISRLYNYWQLPLYHTAT